MIIIKSVKEVKSLLNGFRNQNKIIGFVPTMGALHKGHLSLIEAAEKQCDIVVCSIFVNPTQFNDSLDLQNYPRTMAEDIKLLETTKCDVLFAPEINEVYSQEELELKKLKKEDFGWTKGKTIDFGSLDKVMEGAHRPGHFNGVVQVVSKLFDFIEPNNSFFGQKDYQQLAIIKSMVKQLGLPVEVISCPIMRELDGLAMSSRNTLLSKEERIIAQVISKTLFLIADIFRKNNISELRNIVTENINTEPLMKLEYFEIADGETLLPISSFETAKSAVAFIAVRIGNVRLIDNVILI